MRASCILPDEPIPDYRGRITRRRAARALAKGKRDSGSVRRLGVLAAAVAVPALAMPGGLQGLTMPAADATTEVAPMGFETPGESFPGSAFYYLEDVPTAADGTQASTFGALPAPEGAALLGAPEAATGAFAVGAQARPLVVAGSLIDRARAQQCLTQAIYYEAASESDAGQRAVAQVVLNRVAHPAYPSTVCGVVFQGSERRTGCQFTFTCDGSLARRPSNLMWGRASRIAREALAGVVYAPVGLATHYHTLAVHPYWSDSLDQVAVIGAHQFYRWRGTAGTISAFTGRYLGGEPVPGRQAALMAQADAGPAPDPAQPPAIGFDLPANALASSNHEVAASSPSHVELSHSLPAPGDVPAEASGSRLPGGGAIRAEYARSGSWRSAPRPD